MKSRLEDLSWDDVRVAAVAAEQGSLSGVARRLRISVATAGRRLDRLEASLGVRLFKRGSAGLAPTPEAGPLLSRAAAMTAQVEELVRAAAAGADAVEGVVTLSTLETVVTHVLCPHLHLLRKRHPRIDLIVHSTARVEPLARGRADLALRVVRPNEPRVVGQRIGRQNMALYASPSYLARAPVRRVDDLSGHDVVTFEGARGASPELAWLEARLHGTRPAVQVTTASAIAAAVRGGAGLGILPTLFEGADLVRLTDPDVIPARDLWLVTHEDLRHVPRVRAVADFLIETVGRALGSAPR